MIYIFRNNLLQWRNFNKNSQLIDIRGDHKETVVRLSPLLRQMCCTVLALKRTCLFPFFEISFTRKRSFSAKTVRTFKFPRILSRKLPNSLCFSKVINIFANVFHLPHAYAPFYTQYRYSYFHKNSRGKQQLFSRISIVSNICQDPDRIGSATLIRTAASYSISLDAS